MNIVILSRSPALYSTQSIYKAAISRGHFVQIIDHMYCDLNIDDGKFKVFYNGYELQSIHAIIPRIGATATEYGSYVIRHFEQMGVYTVLKTNSLLKARDKFTSLQILAKNNIPIPNTATTNYSEDLEGFVNMFADHPLIIKLLNSTHGEGVIKAENPKVSVTLLEAFLKLKHKILIQEYIKESSGTDIRAFVVGDKVVAAMERIAQKGEFRSNLHRGAVSKSINLTSEEISIAKKSARVLGLQVAGVDILRSDKGPLVIEVNASPGLEGIETTTNINIARSIISLVERNSKYKL
jgi:ribosomal protein S6--L-glutamate ligase